MINARVYYKNIEQVDCVLEIRLCQETWQKIKIVAARKEKSYSWVVRYMLFRMIKRKSLHQYLKGPLSCEKNEGFYNLDKKVQQQKKGTKLKHRHRLCLYGEDELYIRISAARMRCSMTHLVRLAIELYLDSLLEACAKSKFIRFHEAAWYWLGIKVCYDVEFHNIGISNVYFRFQRYHKLEYW